jgi:hypothetical protein
MPNNYDTHSHPNNKRFWTDIRNKHNPHTFSKHPILTVHGDNLSREGFQPHENLEFNERKLLQILQRIIVLESQHKQELEELAKDIIVKIWGVPREMLDAQLTQNIDGEDFDDSQNDESGEDEEDFHKLPKEVIKQVNKRITLNTLTQGAALHQMQSMHFLIDEKIREISPELLDMYTYFAKACHYHYWLIDTSELEGMLKQSAMGKSDIKWEEQQDGSDKPKVVGQAWIFPALAQELSKGCMELLTMHGYANLDPETQHKVIKHADKLHFEPYQIMVGVPLWKKFLKVLPKDVTIAEVVRDFSSLEPDEIHDVIDKIISNPDEAKNILEKISKT